MVSIYSAQVSCFRRIAGTSQVDSIQLQRYPTTQNHIKWHHYWKQKCNKHLRSSPRFKFTRNNQINSCIKKAKRQLHAIKIIKPFFTKMEFKQYFYIKLLFCSLIQYRLIPSLKSDKKLLSALAAALKNSCNML